MTRESPRPGYAQSDFDAGSISRNLGDISESQGPAYAHRNFDILRLDFPENIPQVPGNRAELGQNHDVRKAVSATISGLK